MASWLPFCQTIAFLVIGIVIPAVRHHGRTGTWPIVFQRRAEPFQRVVGAAFSAVIAAYVAWSIAFIVLGPGPLGIWRPGWPVVGWVLVCLGVAVIVVAQINMGASWRIGIDDRSTGLVTQGLFSVVRNPIFSGMLLYLAGVVLIWPSVLTAIGWLAVAMALGLQVRVEERHLGRLHGDAFRCYASRVGRFVPWLGRLGDAPRLCAAVQGDAALSRPHHRTAIRSGSGRLVLDRS